MAVVSVDLAYKRWRDLGIAVLAKRDPEINVAFERPPDGDLAVEPLAEYLDELCKRHNSHMLLLDGPQAWKDGDNGFEHARVCERKLNTPAKTGLPGTVKPRAYTGFVQFSIDLYDAMCTLGWIRLSRCDVAPDHREKTLVESFPLSAWKALGLTPLGSKRKTKAPDITARLSDLAAIFPLNLTQVPTHDELQALVSGLAGIAMEDGLLACDVAGVPPFDEGTAWREGFIVNPRRVAR